jgi:nuclease-like protein/type III restriction/modification enzyme restriction subunit
MAHMYPPDPSEIPFQSAAEQHLYTVFRDQLGPEYSVVHSAIWHGPDEEGVVRDGEVDFVIIHPDHGLLVLEVKGGGVQVHGLRRRWYTVDRAGKKWPIKNPFDQTKRSMHILLRTLRASPLTAPYAPDYRLSNAVWFPDVAWQHGKVSWLQGLDHLILDAADVDAPEPGLQRIYEHFARLPRAPHAPPPQRLSPEAIAAVVELLNGSDLFLPIVERQRAPRPALAESDADAGPELIEEGATLEGQEGAGDSGLQTGLAAGAVDALTLSAHWDGRLADAIAAEERSIEQLTQAQAERIAQIRRYPRLAIPGAAGTGKTVVALTAAYQFAREGLRVLVLSLSKELAAWHRQLVAAYWNDPRVRFDVQHLRALTAHLLDQLGWSHERLKGLRMDRETDQAKLSSILRNAVDKLRREHPEQLYDAILVDDGHDLNSELWGPIQKLLKDPPHGYLYAFYDLRQRLDFEKRWRLAVGGVIETEALTENLRNTRHIYHTMYLQQPDLAPAACRGPEGRPHVYLDPARYRAGGHAVGSLDAVLVPTLDALIEEQGVRPRDIVVLTCRGENSSALIAKDRRQRALGGNAGDKYVLRWLSAGPPPETASRVGVHITAATMRTAKGLEWPVVVLVELDPLQKLTKAGPGWRYVVASRAKHQLIVLAPPEELPGLMAERRTATAAASRARARDSSPS